MEGVKICMQAFQESPNSYDQAACVLRPSIFFFLRCYLFLFYWYECLPAGMYMHCLYAMPMEAREGIRYLKTGVGDSWVPEIKPKSLREQPVLLASESFFQPLLRLSYRELIDTMVEERAEALPDLPGRLVPVKHSCKQGFRLSSY